MTTYPQVGDPMSAGTEADGTTISHREEHGRVIHMWENAKHYGMKGDGVSDDTAHFQDAIDVVMGDPAAATYGRALFLPQTDGGYVFDGSALDWHTNTGSDDIWYRVYVGGTLIPQTTFTIPARRLTLEGVSGAPHVSFDHGSAAAISGVALGSDPTVNLTGVSTSMEIKNLTITEVTHTAMTVDQGVCELNFDNVSFNVGANSTGSCIQIDGGFGYYFNRCTFNAGSGASAGPAIKLYNADGTDPVRIVWMQNCFLSSRGIYSANGALGNVASQFVFDRILYEGGKECFLTTDSTHGFQSGFNIKNVEFADSLMSPTTALVHNTGSNTYNMNIEGCAGINDIILSGSDRVNGLRYREGMSNGYSNVGQTKYYEVVTRFGERIQAAPFSRPPITDTTTGGSLDCGDGNTFILSASGARSLTAFTNQKAGQNITLIFTNGSTTLFNGANVKLSGGVNFAGTANDVLRLVTDGTTAYEISRSVN